MRNSGEPSRVPPQPVRRLLRREAGFGCPICGDPFLEYHHIVPWREEQHHRPSDMIALCPKHHRQADHNAISRKDLYHFKKNPQAQDHVGDALVVRNWDQYEIRLGSTVSCRKTRAIVRLDTQPILALHRTYERLTLLLKIADPNGRWLLNIEENDWLVNTDGVWDCEVKANSILVRGSGRRDYVKIHLNAEQETVQLDFRFTCFGIDFVADGSGVTITPPHASRRKWWFFRHVTFNSVASAFDLFRGSDGLWGMANVKKPLTLKAKETPMGVNLTLHEQETFRGGTVFLSGHAYVDCVFDGTTLVITNTLYHLERCEFRRCNWHLDLDILWGDPSSQAQLRELLDFIQSANEPPAGTFDPSSSEDSPTTESNATSG